MKTLRWLLLPFSLLYGLVVIIRNWCYDGGILKSRKFRLPVISVGNLDVGGAGKSPMTEYLIRLLKDNYKLAALSRGYGRKTRGFLTVTPNSTAAQVGDEPLQFKHKFPDITVVVCEKRAVGIKELTNTHNLVLMDDAYQHRAVKPGLSILLFDYNRINEPHLLLPAGNLREPFSGRWRADIIIVSKCPEQLSIEEQERITEKISALPYQSLFFTSIVYQPFQDLSGKNSDMILDDNTTVFLLSGIANSKPLVQHIKKYTSKLVHHNYPDHHRFSLKNISKLADEFSACTTQKKVIITTEKDAQRLVEHELLSFVKTLPILVIPIGIEFLNNEGQQFDQLVTDYVREHTANHIIH
ncbi:MAG TPA: tetraacyldisaccharide 4'-kinase [Mucilaginibacter sp.]|nr:tetraacyldisaccharide 4'-kinase [Mucilaginibacter sp.]